MGELTRTYDWSKTALGPPETWPQSLRTTLALMLHSAFPMFLFWGDDLLCFYNDAYRPSLGQNGKHPAVGKPGREVWPEIWDFIGPLIAKVMTTGEPEWFEDQLVPIFRNGQLEDVYWTFSYSPAHGDEGRIAGVFVTCAETTNKVLGIRQLVESRDELNFAVEATELGVWEYNPATSTFKGNARLKEWFGLQPDDDIPLPLALAVIAEADRPRVTAAIERALQPESGGQYDIEYTVIHPPTGYKRRVRAKGRAWFNNEKTAYRFNGTLQDVTDRERAETALRESEARFRRLTDTMPAILWLTDPDGRCTYLNAQWYAYTGQTPAEAEGSGWLNATHPDDKSEAGRLFLDANVRRESFRLVYRLRRHDGAYRWAIDQARPRFSIEGAYEGMIGTVVDVHDQKTAEDALRASEQRFQAAVAAVQGILWTNNAQGKMEGEQPGWAALTGQRYEEYQGYGWANAVHPDDAQPTIDAWKEALQRRGTFEFEHRVRVQSGQWELFSIRAIPLLNPDGTLREWVGVHTNITRQRKAEAAVRASEAKLQSLIAAAPVAIGLFVGQDLIVELPNQTFIDIVGKGPDIVGKPLREVMPELVTENQPFLQILDDVFTSGKQFHSFGSQVKIVQHGVMSYNYYNITYTPLFDENGKVYAILDIAVDVTGQVLAQQKLEETEAALRGAIELAELATWSMDVGQGIFTYSPRFMEWLGFSENTKDLDGAYNPLPDEYRQPVIEALAAAVAPNGPGIYENEHPIINRLTGQVRIIHAQAQVVYDASGKPAFLNGTARDVTKQRQLQQELERQVQERTQQLQATIGELERSNQNLQQFAYVASHDLQEPLRKIQQFGDRLKTRYAERLGDGTDFIDRMQNAASRMSVLIADLLSFSRISTQRDTSAAVSLDEVVEVTLHDLDLVIAETGAHVTAGPLPPVRGDASQLSQLFQNLLSNALKFRRPGVPPVVTITAHRMAAADLPATVRPTQVAAMYHRIDITDNGIGFEPQYAERIFQVFQRLHGRSEYAGTGIGLAICEKVAANHGGAIAAQSQPDEGATFSVYLPVSDMG
jgi:hypothetical protein